MSIHETYYECRELILDSPEVVEEVEKYRQDLKPKKVRIVLLAESHVHTTEKEFSKFLKKDYLHNDGTRCKYVRFVYCLGSSESKILEKPEPAVRRRGQFWRILYSCFHRINATSDFALFDGGSDEERLEQKDQVAWRVEVEWNLARGCLDRWNQRTQQENSDSRHEEMLAGLRWSDIERTKGIGKSRCNRRNCEPSAILRI